ncbi:MAG: hypothetical protein A2V66_17125 [Ignavibacteria bacterium RBG_13_36_8]|nr:MAG: hypothetical protein A2V66_17125 [Ignavibacteria bacterium RBG_13_36_8]
MEKQGRKYRAEVIKVPKRNEIQLSKQEGIFNNGKGNDYPERIENLINSSVTAKSAADMMSRFIVGNGFEHGELNSMVVYSDLLGEITGLELLKELSLSIAYQNACAVNTQINANLKITGIKPLKYKTVRIGKTDSNGYSGFIYLNEKWGKGYKKDKTIQLHSFNMNANVLINQIAGDISKYTGQCVLLSMDKSEIYPNAPIDVCRDDADTESEISQFKNGEVRGGFFAKYIIHHAKIDTEDDAQQLKKTLESFIGGGHENQLLLLEGFFDTDGNWVDDSNIRIEKIEQNINDKIFEGYEKTIANNIRKSFNAIPKILIDSDDVGVFGQSGSAFVEAVKFYNMQTSEYRTSISQFLGKILKYHSNQVIANISNYNIKPLAYGIVDTSGSTDK